MADASSSARLWTCNWLLLKRQIGPPCQAPDVIVRLDAHQERRVNIGLHQRLALWQHPDLIWLDQPARGLPMMG